MYKIFKLKLGILLVFFAVQARAGLSLEAYLKAYLMDSDEVRVNSAKLDIQKLNLEKTDDLFSTELSMGAWLRENKKEFKLSAIEDSRLKNYSLGLTQKLGLGNSLAINYSNYDDFTAPQLSYEDWGWSLSYEQDLWKNSFGKLDSLNVDQAKVTYEKASNDQKMNFAKTCQQGIAKYLETYFNERKSKILLITDQESQAALKLAEKSYKKRLIKKLNILSAKADRKRLEAELSNALNELSIVQRNFLVSISAKDNSSVMNLPEPSKFFESFGEPKLVLNEKENFQLISMEKTYESSKLNLLAVEQSNMPDLKLGLSHKRNQIYSTSKVSNTENIIDSYSTISVNFSTPLWSNTKEAEIGIAASNLKLAKHNKRNSLKNTQSNFNKSVLRYRNLKRLSGYSKEKIDLYAAQLNEANRLLKRAKLEFSDYLTFRDQLFNEKIKALEIQVALWNEKSNLLSYGPNLVSLCKRYDNENN